MSAIAELWGGPYDGERIPCPMVPGALSVPADRICVAEDGERGDSDDLVAVPLLGVYMLHHRSDGGLYLYHWAQQRRCRQ